MGQVFISFDHQDEKVASSIVEGLRAACFTTWDYKSDSLPGPSYLEQIAAAITECEAIIVVVSSDSVRSNQVTNEIVQGLEKKKRFVPLLHGLSHPEFQALQPEWRAAFGAATSIEIPKKRVKAILPSLIRGLKALGVAPTLPASTSQEPISRDASAPILSSPDSSSQPQVPESYFRHLGRWLTRQVQDFASARNSSKRTAGIALACFIVLALVVAVAYSKVFPPAANVAPQLVWEQINTMMVLQQPTDGGTKFPRFFVDRISSGPPTSADDKSRIHELRQVHHAADLPSFLLFVCDIRSDHKLVASFDTRKIQDTALGCEWWSANGDVEPLRDRLILFPDDLLGANSGQFEFQIPGIENGSVRVPQTEGWMVIWAIPLSTAGLKQLDDGLRFQQASEKDAAITVTPPWSFSVRIDGEQ